MKKLFALLLALVLLLTAVAAVADEIVNDWGVLPEVDEAEQSGVAYEYTAIVELYYDALDDMTNNDLSDEIKQEIHNEFLLAMDCGSFGYALKDLDGDGNIELIIATNVPEDPYFGKMILLMATNDGKESEIVLESGERSTYYYAGDNKIAYIGSNGADDSIETTYVFQNGELIDQSVVTPAEAYVQMDLETITVADEAAE